MIFATHRPYSPSTSAREWLSADDTLNRLVQLLCTVEIELANLGCVGNEAFKAVFTYSLCTSNAFFQRLGAHELLCGRHVVVQRFLGIIRELDCNCLEALRHSAKRLHRRVHVGLPKLLYLVNVLQHLHLPAAFRPIR